MPQRRYYGGRGQQSQDMASMYELGRRIREQITGEEERRKKMDLEFEGIELEDAQLRLQELKGKKKRQELQDQLIALEMNRRGDIAAIQAQEGTRAPTLRDMLGGQRLAQLGGEPGTMMNLPTEAGGMQLLPVPGGATMDLPIPDVQLPHRMQQVRGIQMPEMGIDVPGYTKRPQTMQEMLALMAQKQGIENQVMLPPIPGISDESFPVDQRAMSVITRLLTERGLEARQERGFEEKTSEREAGQVFETGKIGRGQVFKAGEAQKGRVSTAEQKRLDRASAERIALLRLSGKPEKNLKEINRELVALDYDEVTSLDQVPAELRESLGLPALVAPSEESQETGTPPVAGAEAPGIHVQAGNQQELTREMADRYEVAAKGDTRLAEKWAREDGWVFPERSGK